MASLDSPLPHSDQRHIGRVIEWRSALPIAIGSRSMRAALFVIV